MSRRTLAGDLRVARSAAHYFLALLWAKMNGQDTRASVAQDAATVLTIVGAVALVGFILNLYLFR